MRSRASSHVAVLHLGAESFGPTLIIGYKSLSGWYSSCTVA